MFSSLFLITYWWYFRETARFQLIMQSTQFSLRSTVLTQI